VARRKLADWLDGYLDYTANQEPTDKLNYWVGIGLISAAMKRQVWMKRVRYKLYPNVYIVLVAESAKARKSIAMDTGVRLLREAVSEVFYISGNMTPEGLVKHTNRQKAFVTETTKGGQKVDVKLDSHLLIHMDEIAESFGYDRNRANKFTILLTKIYGSQDEHMHTLANEDQILLKNLYPVWIGGTDPSNLKVIPEDAIAGLYGRLLLILESKKKRLIAWSNEEEDKKADALHEVLKDELHTISLLSGEMRPTPDAKAIWEAWYNELDTRPAEGPRVEAFRQRCHDTALKLAMIHSLSESNDLIVKPKHVTRGIKSIEEQLSEIDNLAQWSFASDYAQRRASLIAQLRRQGGAGSRSQMMKHLGASLDDIVLLESSLEAEKTIEVAIQGKHVFYKLNKDELMR